MERPGHRRHRRPRALDRHRPVRQHDHRLGGGHRHHPYRQPPGWRQLDAGADPGHQLRQRAGHGGELGRVGGPHLGRQGHGRRRHLCRLRDHPGRLRRAGQSRPSSLPRRADQRRAERRGPGGNGVGQGARGGERGGYPLRGRDVERPVQLSANEAGNLDVAIDGAGDAVATFEQYVPNTSIIALYASKLPAGGSWGPPVLCPRPGTPCRTSWAARRGRLRRDLRHHLDRRDYPDPERAHQPARWRLGTAVTLAPNVGQINGLQIAPGHAVLTFNSVVTTEPVS